MKGYLKEFNIKNMGKVEETEDTTVENKHKPDKTLNDDTPIEDMAYDQNPKLVGEENRWQILDDKLEIDERSHVGAAFPGIFFHNGCCPSAYPGILFPDGCGSNTLESITRGVDEAEIVVTPYHEETDDLKPKLFDERIA